VRLSLKFLHKNKRSSLFSGASMTNKEVFNLDFRCQFQKHFMRVTYSRS
jgi:hypothetical protein